jgi:hypothetical protein
LSTTVKSTGMVMSRLLACTSFIITLVKRVRSPPLL